MRMTVRRYRRRRKGSDSLGFSFSHCGAPFFDRLVYLSQSINQPRKTDTPFIILVTRDKFLHAGIQHSPAPVSHCCVFDTLESAFSALENWPSARLVVDIESRATPLTDLLNALRRWVLYPPFLAVSLLIRADDYDTRLFCKTTGPFEVVERQISADTLHKALIRPDTAGVTQHDYFSRDEWTVLQYLSQGESLRSIAALCQRPYSRIIYRLGRILSKLGLSHRQELLHLLNRLSDPHAITY
ncbi:LuxR C-terminal-related transcriptional regulator [Lelliottia sp. CFBP8978]|jgi:fimbrial regulator|uniref:helix-turn-helix transcriptional regulator n=1 Tax=Lelliottia sp. CFBP8978 TaxID=3096522 RepID=UPI002A69B87F|nr:LuxR C-terminal-related transcriptional regulator [Lelliottia sp. CFBP8978]MDY1036682.1 LuxR C-terminal-related transcriptional regulator [Lelliottia sp. CFBP8978]